MFWGAAAVAAATFGLLLAVFGVSSRRPMAAARLIRASTLSPHEYRLYEDSHRGPYARLLRPLLLLLADRFRLQPLSIAPEDLIRAGVDPEQVSPLEITAMKIFLAGAAGAVSVSLAVAIPAALLLAPAAAWLGFVAPNLYLQARRRARRRQLERELPDFVGLLKAFVNAHVPLEQALNLISAQLASNTADRHLLAHELRQALGRYGLGLTIEESLEAMADRIDVDDLTQIVSAVTQGKRLGTGMDQLLRDQELLVRMNQRNRATAEASRVSTKLMGVLVGVYLPQFVILIMIPLFWGIIQRAFG